MTTSQISVSLVQVSGRLLSEFTPLGNPNSGSEFGESVGVVSLPEIAVGTPVWSLTDSAGGRYLINSSTGEVFVNAEIVAGTDSITVAVTGVSPEIDPTTFDIEVVEASGPTPGQPIWDDDPEPITVEVIEGVPNISFNYAPGADSEREQVRFSPSGTSQWGAWIDLLSEGTLLEFTDGQDNDVQVRGVSSTGKKGAASETRTFAAPWLEPGDPGEVIFEAIDVNTGRVSFSPSTSTETYEYQLDGAGWLPLTVSEAAEPGRLEGTFALPISPSTGSYLGEVRGVNPELTGDATSMTFYNTFVIPNVSSLFPTPDAVDVSRAASFIVTYDKNVQAGGAGKAYYLYNSDNVLIHTYDIVANAGVGAGQVSISGAVVTMVPPSTLPEGMKEHYIRADEGVVVDTIEGWGSALINDPSTWSFVTRARPTTVSLLNSTLSQDPTITVPPEWGVQEGDLLVLGQYSRNAGTSAPGPEIPSGFFSPSIHSASTGAFWARGEIDRKICDGTEGGQVLTGMDGDVEDRKVLLHFRADSKISRVNRPNVAQSQFTNGIPTDQVIPSAAAVVPAIVLALYASTGASSISPRNMSPSKTGEVSSTNAFWLAYKIYDASPANVTVGMEDEGSNHLASNFIELE